MHAVSYRLHKLRVVTAPATNPPRVDLFAKNMEEFTGTESVSLDMATTAALVEALG